LLNQCPVFKNIKVNLEGIKMLDLDKRSKVINLCSWTVSFTLPISKAEIILEGGKSTNINNSELVTLADNQDIMFYGLKDGDHARVYVDNKDFREYVGFDDPEQKRMQFVLTNEECQKIFDLKQDAAFKKNIKEKVVLSHEKYNIMAYARKNKLNDYNKIKFLEEYTELTF
jgi:hypothetical protein